MYYTTLFKKLQHLDGNIHEFFIKKKVFHLHSVKQYAILYGRKEKRGRLMDQNNLSFEEQSRIAKESTRRLKRKMIIILVCMVAFAIISIPLINLLSQIQNEGNKEEETKAPSSTIIFATPDFDYNILEDERYLNLNRRIYLYDERSGITEDLTDKNINAYGEAAIVLRAAINALIAGDADAYNALFSENYYATHKPQSAFTMQRIYDIKLTLVKETEKVGETGKYTQYEYEVEYKIQRNDGTFRTDIGHDESRKQYFVLSDSVTGEVLIDQILNYIYR